MNFFKNKITSVLFIGSILCSPLFVFGQNAGGTPYFSDPVECASSFHLYDNVNLYQIVDGVVTGSFGTIPDDPTDEQLTATRDAITNGEYGCQQETVIIAGISETVYVLDTTGLAEDSNLGDLTDQNKVCAANQTACDAQRAGWYPNASGCSTDSVSGDICFYHLLEGTATSTVGQTCGSYDDVTSRRTECFASLALCNAGEQLSADQSGETLVSSCPASGTSGTCDSAPTYCYTVQTFEIGQGLECGAPYSADSSGNPLGGQTSTGYANSLISCQRERNHYVGTVPNCFPSMVSAQRGEFQFQQCFDAEGLRKKSDQEIADEEAVLLAELEADRLAELERIRLLQQAAYDGTTFGGVEGGLVPECGEDGKGKTCGWIEFVQLVNNIINFIIWAAAVIMVIVLLLAGFKLVTSQGKPDALASAKTAMGRAVLGFCVVLFAWLLVSTFLQSFLRSDFLADDVVNLLEDQ